MTTHADTTGNCPCDSWYSEDGKQKCDRCGKEKDRESEPATMEALLARCKCGVHLTVNQHRNLYEKAAEYLKDQEGFNGDEPVAEPEILQRMIETDTILHLQFYPDTPIGFYSIYHYDLQAAIDEALTCFPDRR